MLSAIMFREPLRSLLELALQDERFTHTVITPFITAALLYLRRKDVFRGCQYCPGIGIPLIVLGIALWQGLSGPTLSLDPNDRLAVMSVPVILSWLGGFILCYGTGPFRAALFPLLFLFFMAPPPTAVLSNAVYVLQKGSAEATEILFKLAGIPMHRQDFLFSLPGVDIEIAEQCSGIRSSLSLFLSGVLASHLFLQSAWKRACLILLTIPIAIFKNAVRIVTISWFGIYVNSDVFYGALHSRGGLVFSVLALAMLGCCLLVLRGWRPSSKHSRQSAGAQIALR
jgi:exosortase